MSWRRAVTAAVVVAGLLPGCAGSGDQRADSDEILSGPISTRPGTTGATDGSDTSLGTATSADPRGAWSVLTEDLANAAGSPRILVSDGDTIQRVDRGVAVQVADPSERIGVVVGDGTGTIFYELLRAGPAGAAASVDIVRGRSDGSSHRLTLAPHHEVHLHDARRVNGSTKLLYALFRDSEQTDPVASLLLRDLTSGRVTTIAEAAGPNLLLTRAALGGDLVVLTYTWDQAERVEFRDLTGTVVERPSPTDDVAVGSPPFIRSAVLSTDGTEVAYVEGPDRSGSDEEVSTRSATALDWDVVVVDDEGEQLRLTVADADEVSAVTIDFDGRWLLVSGTDAAGPVEPLLIDTEATDLAMYLVAGVRGVARLEPSAPAA